jgi:hypothetical protein
MFTMVINNVDPTTSSIVTMMEQRTQFMHLAEQRHHGAKEHAHHAQEYSHLQLANAAFW